MPVDDDGTPDPSQRVVFRERAPSPVMMTVGPDGQLCHVSLTGSVRWITYPPANVPPIAAFTARPRFGTAPLSVLFDATGSADPNGHLPLRFAWDLDGDGRFDDSTLVAPAWVYEAPGRRTVRVRVTDAGDASEFAALLLDVVSEPAGNGDVNCDGIVDFFDIDPFVRALFDPSAYVTEHPACDLQLADIDDSGSVDFFDIDPFLTLLFQ